MKILFPTDGSAQSLAALERLVPRLAWFPGAELALVNVHPQIAYGRAVAWAGREAVHRYYDEESSEALAPATALLGDRGVSYERVQRIGDPAVEIVRFAHEWGADLIAMGRHGQSAVATLLMGSVAQKVLATANLPVLVL
ncbi:MAG: universal stress protein [Burkholderiales bacterium]